MTKQLQIAKERLFGQGGLDVANIKLFPGTNRDATPEQMAETINNVIADLESGDYELVDESLD